MNYKIGDKVRIVNKWGAGCNQNPEGKMDKWLGKVMTIIGITSVGKYKMKEDQKEFDGDGWFWNDFCIAGLAHQEKIVITANGNETLARMYSDGKVVKSAVAKCAPDDTFDFEVGAKLAFERLTEKKDEKKKG